MFFKKESTAKPMYYIKWHTVSNQLHSNVSQAFFYLSYNIKTFNFIHRLCPFVRRARHQHGRVYTYIYKRSVCPLSLSVFMTEYVCIVVGRAGSHGAKNSLPRAEGISIFRGCPPPPPTALSLLLLFFVPLRSSLSASLSLSQEALYIPARPRQSCNPRSFLFFFFFFQAPQLLLRARVS